MTVLDFERIFATEIPTRVVEAAIPLQLLRAGFLSLSHHHSCLVKAACVQGRSFTANGAGPSPAIVDHAAIIGLFTLGKNPIFLT